jgi:hypothetical protein
MTPDPTDFAPEADPADLFPQNIAELDALIAAGGGDPRFIMDASELPY